MKPKTLDQINWNEISEIECGLVNYFNKEYAVCRVHTIDGEDYEVDPIGAKFSNNNFKILLKE